MYGKSHLQLTKAQDMVTEATQQAADMRLEHAERVAFQMRKTRESESEQIAVCTPATDKRLKQSL
jgi:hypothetical protein